MKMKQGSNRNEKENDMLPNSAHDLFNTVICIYISSAHYLKMSYVHQHSSNHLDFIENCIYVNTIIGSAYLLYPMNCAEVVSHGQSYCVLNLTKSRCQF